MANLRLTGVDMDGLEEPEGMLCPSCNKWRPKAYCPWCSCATKGYVTQEKFDQEEARRNNSREKILPAEQRQEKFDSRVNCPKCASPMVIRVAKRGINQGQSFWGCTKYPGCLGKRPVNINGVSVVTTPIASTQSALVEEIIHLREVPTIKFEGTIIDIETIGDFDRSFKHSGDSREYRKLQQIIFGYLDSKELHVMCAKGPSAIKTLEGEARAVLESLKKPFYAYQCDFERGVWFHQLGTPIEIENELQQTMERKEAVCRRLGIAEYDDPFHGEGYRCEDAWLREDYATVIAHNRSCLLKEREIMLLNGCCKPNVLKLVC